MHKSKTNIKDLEPDQLKGLVTSLGHKPFRAKQILQLLFRAKLTDFAEMKQLPLDLRNQLSEQYEIMSMSTDEVQRSSDGSIKCLFRLHDGYMIESVLIPEADKDGKNSRLTLCISSQAGCALGCKFCATGTLGLERNLNCSEIIDQYLLARQISGREITNIVFMGMGEPLQNLSNVIRAWDIFTDPDNNMLSPRRITLSTSGLIRQIRELADSGRRAKLALSLHGTTQGQRMAIMPVANSNPLKDMRRALEYYYSKTELPLTYEYIVFAGFNDSDEDIKRLARIAGALPSRVNLIPYHDTGHTGQTDSLLKAASPRQINNFADRLRKAGVNVFVRSSSGLDIDAACGQLALSRKGG